MNRIAFFSFALASTCTLTLACSTKSEPPTGSATTTTASSSAPAPAAAAAKGAGKSVALDPLPLAVRMPESEAAVTMDKTMGARKSVGVSYDALNAGFNVSEPEEKSFDEVKKRIKADVLYPFKKWVKEEPKAAIAEFNEGGKTGYLAYAWKEVGGKPYVCQSAGMAGLASAADAEKVLAVCDSLTTK